MDQARGRFRSFLLTAFNHFLASAWHRDRAVKRGGGQALISLDGVEAEDRCTLEPADTLTPEAIYDRRWALTGLDQSIARRLRERYRAALRKEIAHTVDGTEQVDEELRSLLAALRR